MRPDDGIEDLVYDFDRDVWVEPRYAPPWWTQKELPAPSTPPRMGRWHSPEDPRIARFQNVATFGALDYPPTWPPIYGTHWATEADLLLLETPDDFDVCLMEIAIRETDGYQIGVDRGVAWFEEGRLLFNGHRTSFAVGGEDALPRSEWPPYVRALPIFALPLRNRRDHLRFQALRHEAATARHVFRFFERLTVFRTLPPPSRGPRQWPPFEP